MCDRKWPLKIHINKPLVLKNLYIVFKEIYFYFYLCLFEKNDIFNILYFPSTQKIFTREETLKILCFSPFCFLGVGVHSTTCTLLSPLAEKVSPLRLAVSAVIFNKPFILTRSFFPLPAKRRSKNGESCSCCCCCYEGGLVWSQGQNSFSSSSFISHLPPRVSFGVGSSPLLLSYLTSHYSSINSLHVGNLCFFPCYPPALSLQLYKFPLASLPSFYIP